MCILSYFCRWNRVCTKTTLPLYHLLFSCLNVLIPPPSWSPGNKCTSNLTWIDATELTPPLLCCVYNIAWKSHLDFSVATCTKQWNVCGHLHLHPVSWECPPPWPGLHWRPLWQAPRWCLPTLVSQIVSSATETDALTKQGENIRRVFACGR